MCLSYGLQRQGIEEAGGIFFHSPPPPPPKTGGEGERKKGMEADNLFVVFGNDFKDQYGLDPPITDFLARLRTGTDERAKKLRKMVLPGLWTPVIRNVITKIGRGDGLEEHNLNSIVSGVYPEFTTEKQEIFQYYSPLEDKVFDGFTQPGDHMDRTKVPWDMALGLKYEDTIANPVVAIAHRSSPVGNYPQRRRSVLYGYNAIARLVLLDRGLRKNTGPFAEAATSSPGIYFGGFDEPHVIGGEISSWMVAQGSPKKPAQLYRWMIRSVPDLSTKIPLDQIASSVIKARKETWYSTEDVNIAAKLTEWAAEIEPAEVGVEIKTVERINRDAFVRAIGASKLKPSSYPEIQEGVISSKAYDQIDPPEEVLGGGTLIPTVDVPLVIYNQKLIGIIKKALTGWNSSEIRRKGADSRRTKKIQELEKLKTKLTELRKQIGKEIPSWEHRDASYGVRFSQDHLDSVPILMHHVCHEDNLREVLSSGYSYESLKHTSNIHKDTLLSSSIGGPFRTTQVKG